MAGSLQNFHGARVSTSTSLTTPAPSPHIHLGHRSHDIDPQHPDVPNRRSVCPSLLPNWQRRCHPSSHSAGTTSPFSQCPDCMTPKLQLPSAPPCSNDAPAAARPHQRRCRGQGVGPQPPLHADAAAPLHRSPSPLVCTSGLYHLDDDPFSAHLVFPCRPIPSHPPQPAARGHGPTASPSSRRRSCASTAPTRSPPRGPATRRRYLCSSSQGPCQLVDSKPIPSFSC
jgi:hypothetical protein